MLHKLSFLSSSSSSSGSCKRCRRSRSGDGGGGRHLVPLLLKFMIRKSNNSTEINNSKKQHLHEPYPP